MNTRYFKWYLVQSKSHEVSAVFILESSTANSFGIFFQIQWAFPRLPLQSFYNMLQPNLLDIFIVNKLTFGYFSGNTCLNCHQSIKLYFGI